MYEEYLPSNLWFSALLPKLYPEFYHRLCLLLQKHRIDHELLQNTKDIWARDYMPVHVVENEFVQFVYEPDYLKPIKYRHLKSNPDDVCVGLNINRKKSKLTVDGGNVVQNRNHIIMCDKVFRENPGLSEKEITDELISLFKTDKIYFIPWNKNDFTGHADGMVRFIDEKNVFINAWTDENPEHDRLLRKALIKHGFNLRELPYCPPEDPSYESAQGLYLNYLELEKAVLVPVFGVKEDDEAIKIIEDAFSSKTILPIECNEVAVKGGVLNCISWNFSDSLG
jgi:agmatine deiminase